MRLSYAQGPSERPLAGGMLAAGPWTSERVGIWSPNRAEWALTQYATAKLGVILVNISPAHRTSELEFVLRQSGCRCPMTDTDKVQKYKMRESALGELGLGDAASIVTA